MAVTFNDKKTGQGLYQHLLFLSGKTESTFKIKDATRLLNFALDRYTHLAMVGDGEWQIDDFGNDTFARARRSLICGQKDYTIPVDYLRIDRVEIKDEGGTWHKLDQIDAKDVRNQSLNEFEKMKGLPRYYDLVNSSLILHPAPEFSGNELLEVTYLRPFDHFSPDDTTSSINIPSIHAEYLVLHALSRSTLRSTDVNMNHVRQDVIDYERMIKDGLSQRNNDTETHLVPNINVRK